jgi:hypothetical protein
MSGYVRISLHILTYPYVPSSQMPVIQIPPPSVNTACADVLLPCIRGRVAAQLPNYLVEMENMPLADLSSGQTIQATSDDTLMNCLCQSRAVLPFTINGSQYTQIECIAPAKMMTTASAAQWSSSVIVCFFKPEPWLTATELAVLQLSLLRDTLLESEADHLSEACRRPRWCISKHDLKDWYFFMHLSEAPSASHLSQLRCTEAGQGEQSRLAGLTHYLLRSKTRPLVNRISPCTSPLAT